jgi:hypothetical protein
MLYTNPNRKRGMTRHYLSHRFFSNTANWKHCSVRYCGAVPMVPPRAATDGKQAGIGAHLTAHRPAQEGAVQEIALKNELRPWTQLVLMSIFGDRR